MNSLNRFWLVTAGLAIAGVLPSISYAQEPGRHETVIDGVVFSLAEGLQLEKVASEPLIKWPIVADWDSQGRLVVAESGGVGWPIQEHNKQALHRIVRLVDDNQDGKFDQRIVAVDKLAFPEGVLCVGNDILVSAPPEILKFSDADQDGICETREVWFDGTTVTNCANDLHGPYLGRDGWIYWCKGAFGEQTHELRDGRLLKSTAAHIYRRHPDGDRIEPLITGGMDNPVEVAFIPEGEKFFTSTFLQHPGGGLRDGIAHAVYGGLFGKDHEVIQGHVRTGQLMPVMTQLGPAAPSGLICLESDHLVRSQKTAADDRFLAAALFNLHKVTSHRLIPQGASYQTEDHDLVTTERVDFHPTDVIEDGDGSLLILDTGGWYDLCCPTSRIDQTTASGGIYRLSKKDLEKAPPQSTVVDWSSTDLDTALSLLHDSRSWIRRSAGERVVGEGEAAIDALRGLVRDETRTLDERLTAVWTLCQIGTARAITAVAEQIDSTNPSLSSASCHVIAVHNYQQATSTLTRLLHHPSAQVRRAAAEALGRVGTAESLQALLDAIERSDSDRHLDHSLLFAMVEISRRTPDTDLKSLATSDKQMHAIILVLHQLSRSQELDPALLLRSAQSTNVALRDASLEVLSSHPDWAASSLDAIEGYWTNMDSSPEQSGTVLSAVLSGWREQADVKKLISGWLESASQLSPSRQLFLAENLDQVTPRNLWPEWSGAIGTWIEATDANTQHAIAQSLAQLDLTDNVHDALIDRVVALASTAPSESLRLQLLSSVPVESRVAGSELEQQLLSVFVDSENAHSNLASDAVLRCKLSQSQAERLANSLAEVSPQHLMTAIESVRRSGILEIESAMLSQLRDLPAARTLPRGFLSNLYQKADESLRKQAEVTTRELESPPADVKRAVDTMLAKLGTGDPVKGLQVFRSERAACSGCHRMGYIGKEIGPDLTHIGGSRTPEALLEAILYPSARLEQSYQSTQILTTDGQTYNGLLRPSSGDSLELILNAERKVTIPRDEIDEMQASNLSVMPQGIEQLLTPQDLADLLALLRSAQ